MERQWVEGSWKNTTGTIKEKSGEAVGTRHLEIKGRTEKTEDHIRSGAEKAMDAVRDVINNEKKSSDAKAGTEFDSVSLSRSARSKTVRRVLR